MPRISDQMPDDVGARPRRVVSDTPNLDLIVCDQPVAAFYDFEGSLGFTDAALAQDQDTLAVDLDQDAVHRDTRSQLDIQVLHKGAHELRGCLTGSEERNTGLFGGDNHFLESLMTACQNQARNLLFKKRSDPLSSRFGREFVQKSVLHIADHLDPVRTEMVVIPRELKTGARHVRDADSDLVEVAG